MKIDHETKPADHSSLPADLVGMLTWAARDVNIPVVGKKSTNRPGAEQRLLDVLAAAGGSVGATARYLGTGTGQLTKLLCADAELLVAANRIRAGLGFNALQPKRAKKKR